KLCDGAGKRLVRRASKFLEVCCVRLEGPIAAVGQETLEQGLGASDAIGVTLPTIHTHNPLRHSLGRDFGRCTGPPGPCAPRQAQRFNCQATRNADARSFTRAGREDRHHESDAQPADFPDPRAPATWETRSTSHVATLSTKLPARLNRLLRYREDAPGC